MVTNWQILVKHSDSICLVASAAGMLRNERKVLSSVLKHHQVRSSVCTLTWLWHRRKMLCLQTWEEIPASAESTCGWVAAGRMLTEPSGSTSTWQWFSVSDWKKRNSVSCAVFPSGSEQISGRSQSLIFHETGSSHFQRQ